MKFIPTIVVICCVALSFAGISQMQNMNEHNLEVLITPSKTMFLLGEIANFDVSLHNNGDSSTRIFGGLGVEQGTIRIYISKDNKTYQQYLTGKWGKAELKSPPIDINAKNSVNRSIAILWNIKPEIETLARDVQEQISKERIMTDYGFPSAGDYYLKATCIIHLSSTPTLIESMPVKIRINEPDGADLEVWNRIKDGDDFAYFMQEGSVRIPVYKTEERAKFLAEVEDILQKYPNSFYSESLRQSMAKFQANEEKREEMMKKMRKSGQ